MRKYRQSEMEALIEKNRSMTMEELQKAFGVSMNTIRADVASLVESGAVRKVYGGVEAVQDKQVPLFSSNLREHADIKKRISSYAASLIEDGDIVYLDAGTTTMNILDYLSPEKKITILTPNLHLIRQAAEMKQIQLVVLPGTLDRRTYSMTDAGTSEFLSRYQIDRSFIGTGGIAPGGAMSVSCYPEYEIKRTAMRQSREKYLVADSSKYGESNLMTFGLVSQMTGVITDDGIPDTFRVYCLENKVALKIV